jgi:hypothetical protein
MKLAPPPKLDKLSYETCTTTKTHGTPEIILSARDSAVWISMASASRGGRGGNQRAEGQHRRSQPRGSRLRGARKVVHGGRGDQCGSHCEERAGVVLGDLLLCTRRRARRDEQRASCRGAEGAGWLMSQTFLHPPGRRLSSNFSEYVRSLSAQGGRVLFHHLAKSSRNESISGLSSIEFSCAQRPTAAAGSAAPSPRGSGGSRGRGRAAGRPCTCPARGA